MVSIPIYERSVRAAPVTGQKQQAVSVGFGEGIGQAITGFGKEAEKLVQRIDESATMELDARLGDANREIEASFLASRQHNAIEAEGAAREAWDRTSAEFLAQAKTPGQRDMLTRRIAQRRENWLDRASTHVGRETEAWHVGSENALVGSLSNDILSYDVGSPERAAGYTAMGAMIRQIAARRGMDGEQTVALGREVFSNIHLGTIDLLQPSDPEGALAYAEEHQDQIEQTKYAQMIGPLREQALSFEGDRVMGDYVAGRSAPAPVTVDDEGGRPTQLTVVSPVPAGSRVSSGYGRRAAPGGRGSTNHLAIDYAVPVNTPVTAALPGTVRIINASDGYGLHIEIDHGRGIVTRYAHLNRTTVRDGMRVEQGQAIALSGGAPGTPGAGTSTGPHLHFAYLVNGVGRDPAGIIGQTTTVQPGSTPAGAAFITEDDVRDRARELANGDPVRERAFVRAGMSALAREDADKNRREAQARRDVDTWLGANPDATWETVPSRLKTGLDPSYSLSLQRSLTPDPEDTDNVAANDLYLDLLDKAAVDPGAFLRDFEASRQIIGETRYAALRGHARTLATATPEGQQTIAQTVATINDEVTLALSGAGFQMSGQGRGMEDAQAETDLRSYMMVFAQAFQNSPSNPTGRPPTVAELRQGLRAGMIRLRSTERGQPDVYAFQSRRPGTTAGPVIERDAQQAIRWQLMQELGGGRVPTQAQIDAAYGQLTRRGTVDDVIERYRNRNRR